ncbi:MAG: aminotransferase class I/II-fold pyridoxal phosphate-dependent enzyme, partial [Nanoarchaeota archaeon]
FMFSTGISPPDTASALASLQILKRDKSLREKLLWNANYLRKGLKKLGFDVGGELQIIPLIIGDVKKTMESQRLLEKEGIFVTGIRPPTVRTARLRISVMATHTKEQLNMALSGFERLIERV